MLSVVVSLVRFFPRRIMTDLEEHLTYILELKDIKQDCDKTLEGILERYPLMPVSIKEYIKLLNDLVDKQMEGIIALNEAMMTFGDQLDEIKERKLRRENGSS